MGRRRQAGRSAAGTARHATRRAPGQERGRHKAERQAPALAAALARISPSDPDGDLAATGSPQHAALRLLARSRLPVPDAGPAGVLRLAGLPVLLAALVTGPVTSTYVVRKGETLSEIAERHGTDALTLARANQLPDPQHVLVGQRLAVPAARPAPSRTDGRTDRRAGGRSDGGANLQANRRADAVTYTVRPGDTVWEIAASAGISPQVVVEANGLNARALILPGQRLVLPGARLPASHAGAQGRQHRARPRVYVVRPGDTMSAIAARFGVDLDDTLRRNRLTTESVLHGGRKVLLPRRSGAPRRETSPGRRQSHTYVVRPGDTLWGVATRARVSLADLFSLNKLGPDSVLQAGRRLVLPGARPTAAAPAVLAASGYPRAVGQAAAANRAALARRSAPGPQRARSLVVGAARRFGVDPALALAVAHQESGFDQRQVSPANAIGLMQVIPSSGAWASTLVGRRLDLLDARDNAVAGVAILRALLTATSSERTAIAGYYQGLSSVRRQGMFADTRRYVANVQTLKARYS